MAKKEAIKNSPLAVVAFVLSLLFFIPILPIIGTILGIIALVVISKNPNQKGKGFAIAAIIIGILVFFFQILILFALSSLFGFLGGIISSVEQGPVEGINKCLEQNPSPVRDLCIFMVVSVNINQTDTLDPNLCDDHVQNEEIKIQCNAFLKKDKSYCEKITVPQSRINCLGMIEEFKNQ